MTFPPWARSAVDVWITVLVLYFWMYNFVSLLLLVSSYFSVKRDERTRPLVDLLKRPSSLFAPPISVLAPAYNEQASIVDSVKSFLSLEYPAFEVIVINDGSRDATMERLKDAFSLYPAELFYDGRLSRTAIKGTYRSRLHENLIVVDKANGGKADALNVGIGFSRYDLFCAVDSDSLLEADALAKIALPFVQSPERTLASGGTVRVVNGSVVDHGRVRLARAPRRMIALVQAVEYLRAFLYGRVGWSAFNTTLIISGAFGAFQKQRVIDIGGYKESTVGEDMELVVRLHRYFSQVKGRYSIVFIPEPVCWTEVPVDLKTLARQRDRWQRGLAQTLADHKRLLLRRRYGLLAFFTFPYFVAMELWGPLLELLGYLSVPLLYWLGLLDRGSLIAFLVLTLGYGFLISMVAVLIEENHYARYGKLGDFLYLTLAAFVENVGYRQLTLVWKLSGLVKYFRGNTSWGQMQRQGFGSGTSSGPR